MVLMQDEIKKALGEKAAEFVQEGMLVGLGSGTTAGFFIESLIKRAKEGLDFTAVSSSNQSMDLARSGGIKVIEMDDVTSIDLTVDGADEIDSRNRMIKGGGGAHVREKILASSSKQLIIIVDESKLVDQLGACGLPIEILPFGHTATLSKINKLGYHGEMRKSTEGSFYITDNHNYIYDLHIPKYFANPEEDHQRLLCVPGVLDTGFFFDLPVKVLVGYANGQCAFRKPV